MVVNIIKRSKKNKSCNKSSSHFQALRILTGAGGRLAFVFIRVVFIISSPCKGSR